MLFGGALVLLLLEKYTAYKVLNDQGVSSSTCYWLDLAIKPVISALVTLMFVVIPIGFYLEPRYFLRAVPVEGAVWWLLAYEAAGIAVAWGSIWWKLFMCQISVVRARSQGKCERQALTVVVVLEHIGFVWLTTYLTVLWLSTVAAVSRSLLVVELFNFVQVLILWGWVRSVVAMVKTHDTRGAVKCVLVGLIVSLSMILPGVVEIWPLNVVILYIAIWGYIAIAGRILWNRLQIELPILTSVSEDRIN